MKFSFDIRDPKLWKSAAVSLIWIAFFALLSVFLTNVLFGVALRPGFHRLPRRRQTEGSAGAGRRQLSCFFCLCFRIGVPAGQTPFQTGEGFKRNLFARGLFGDGHSGHSCNPADESDGSDGKPDAFLSVYAIRLPDGRIGLHTAFHSDDGFLGGGHTILCLLAGHDDSQKTR